MKDRKTLLRQSTKQIEKQSGFNLVQVDLLNESDIVIRTSYEVLDSDEEAIGRFGSLQEAQKFIQMLCLLNEQEPELKQ